MGKGHPLLKLIKPLLAVAVLALVFSMLPLADRLTYADVGGAEVSFPGVIKGDWKSESILFELEEDGLALLVERDGAVRPAAEAGMQAVGGGATWEPGMGTVFASVQGRWVALAMGLFMLVLLCGVTRWWRLLAVVDCRTSWRNAFRLTYLGLFFNLVMPGLTGGDVAKAVLVVREHPEQRGAALMSVFVDRLIGLGTLAVMALVAVLMSGETFVELRRPMLFFLGAGVLGTLTFFNRRVRRALRLDQLLEKLPFAERLRSLDEAARIYFTRPFELLLAVLLSVGNHAGVILAVWALGMSFGVTAADVTVLDYFALVPIANIVSSIPIMPAGWGVGEAAYIYLFGLIGASASLGVAVSVSFRLCQLPLSLVGGLFLLTRSSRAQLKGLDMDPASSTND